MNDDEYIAYLNREGVNEGAQNAREEVTHSHPVSMTGGNNQEASFQLD